jgi:hypothetical protein
MTMRKGTTVQAISTAVLSWKLAGLVAHRLAVLEDGIEHHPEHGEEDDHADDHHHDVQEVLRLGDLGDGRVQVELAHGRPAGQVLHLSERGAACGQGGGGEARAQALLRGECARDVSSSSSSCLSTVGCFGFGRLRAGVAQGRFGFRGRGRCAAPGARSARCARAGPRR